jgi:hypothetical protein
MQFAKKLVPVEIKSFLKCMSILEFEYGHNTSRRKHASVDRNGDPIPWYTYPAIEYIKQLDFSTKTVFEYGSGNSSLFWASLAKSVLSIEDDRDWYNKILSLSKPNLEIRLVPNKTDYVNEILRCDTFDVIIIDGSHRFECAHNAIQRLKPGGMIILDNADWFVKTTHLLRDAGLIEVDMAGFGPINPYTSTTSFFLRNDFGFKPKNATQPVHGIGSLKQYSQELAPGMTGDTATDGARTGEKSSQVR